MRLNEVLGVTWETVMVGFDVSLLLCSVVGGVAVLGAVDRYDV